MLSYLLQMAVSSKVATHKHACFLPLQHSKREQQPHKWVILTGVNDQLVPHFCFSHVLAMLLGTVFQTVLKHLLNIAAFYLVYTGLSLLEKENLNNVSPGRKYVALKQQQILPSCKEMFYEFPQSCLSHWSSSPGPPSLVVEWSFAHWSTTASGNLQNVWSPSDQSTGWSVAWSWDQCRQDRTAQLFPGLF